MPSSDAALSRRALVKAASAAPLAAHAGAGRAREKPPRPAGAEGFDFLLGVWRVEHRRLKARLARSQDWEAFPGRLKVRPILGGLGDVDDNLLEVPGGGYVATSLRLFDPKRALWSIYWIDGRAPGIDAPLVGRFEGKIGRFYNDDTFGGRPIKVRFIYEDLGPDAARWSQAFSPDAGATWEVNWTMDFHRLAPAIGTF
jgi:hypothetical protein